MSYHNRLVTILLSWICVSASHLTHLRCPQLPSNCSITTPTEWTENEAFFDVDGLESLLVKVEIPEEVSYLCEQLNPDSSASYFKSFPKFDRVYYFETVILGNCGLPQEPYLSTLDALNITGFHNLVLNLDSCEQNTLFSLLVGLYNLLTLHIASFSCPYPIEFDFLNQIDSLKNLLLYGIRIPPFPSWNLLRSISMSFGGPSKPLQVWGGCRVLEELKVENWDVAELPDSWLAHCSRLTSIHLDQFKELRNLPTRVLNSTYLLKMKLIGCNISELPGDFFKHIRNLRLLDLSKNKLRWLGRDTFSPLTSLEELVLTDNDLYITSMYSFKLLSSLNILILDGNIHYTGCNIFEVDMKLFNHQFTLLPSLECLSLEGCGVTEICSYWNHSMPKLKYLNLASTKIIEVKYKDVELIQSNGWDVDLRNSMLKAIVFTKSDYEAVLNMPPSASNATIRIGHSINGCDYRWYWFARTIIEYPNYLSLPDLLFNQQWGKLPNHVLLKKTTLESFVCKDYNCQPDCRCFKRHSDNTVQINCTGAGLSHIPRYAFLRILHMAFNNIKTIHAYDLPETLEYMDLQNNQLSTVDMETASTMFNRSKIVYNLENNNIICDCNNSAFINLLQTHKNQLENYENVACADGSLLHRANTFVLCLRNHTPVIASVLGAIAILCLIAIFLYYRYKTQIFVILYARGWCACCVNEQELDKDKVYDVFISFAHQDTSLVMDQLVPELEKEPHAFSVCVHYRDWMPGEWIPTQIAHSVLQSRRTIIILSENFLSSVWALLEFRTAHIQAMKDGRVRLIIVLLGEIVNNEGMDDELRAYLTTNTYIKWGDAMFWDKLRYALPHRGHEERRSREAGEEVLRLARPTDPPIFLHDMTSPNNNIMLSIEPAQN